MRTTVNGKEIKLFGRNEIGMAFTEKVNEYLIKGFIFYLGEEGRGHQGEETKVCLTNDDGKTVYVIFLDKVYNGFEKPDTMELFVKKYENSGRIFWMKEGEEIFRKVFYEITEHCRKDVYVETLEESQEIKKIRDERFEIRCSIRTDRFIVLDEKYKKLALKLLNKVRGCKSKKLCDIKEVGKLHGHFVVHDYNYHSWAF